MEVSSLDLLVPSGCFQRSFDKVSYALSLSLLRGLQRKTKKTCLRIKSDQLGAVVTTLGSLLRVNLDDRFQN